MAQNKNILMIKKQKQKNQKQKQKQNKKQNKTVDGQLKNSIINNLF